MNAITKKPAAIDGTAILLSSLCLVHCLALPLLSTALPILGVVAEAEWLHRTFVIAALPFAVLALISKQISWVSAVLILSGSAFLVAGAFVEAWHDYETLLTVIGGVLLAAGHATRWRRAHQA